MKRKLLTATLFAFCLGFMSNPVFSQVNMASTGSYTQNFNTLASSGINNTWTDNSTIANWYAQKTGSGSLYDASDGSITTNNGGGTASANGLSSFGSTSSSDRALGSYGAVLSSFPKAGDFAYGVLLRNTSAAAITNITVSWTLEQWREPGTIVTNTITFWYKTSSSAITALNPNSNGTWTSVTALNSNCPQFTGTAQTLDGNLSANRVVKTNIAIPSLSLAQNDYIMLKWDDTDFLGQADHSTSIDDVTITWNATALPIELINFDATTEGSKNRLTWATASETNNKGFEIERSTDGTTFHSIGQVKGNNKPSSYQFVDHQPFATSYYRLKQVDFDGTETLSKVVSVELKGKGKGLKVYPTLVSNGILTVDTEGGQLRDFSVMNLLGQQVLVGKTTTQIDVSSLAKGTYILKVGSEVAKFVKQ